MLLVAVLGKSSRCCSSRCDFGRVCWRIMAQCVDSEQHNADTGVTLALVLCRPATVVEEAQGRAIGQWENQHTYHTDTYLFTAADKYRPHVMWPIK